MALGLVAKILFTGYADNLKTCIDHHSDNTATPDLKKWANNIRFIRNGIYTSTALTSIIAINLLKRRDKSFWVGVQALIATVSAFYTCGAIYVLDHEPLIKPCFEIFQKCQKNCQPYYRFPHIDFRGIFIDCRNEMIYLWNL